MEIVLLERVENLGDMGDVVTVKPGYGRNFLLPQQKALRATKANMARFEAQREYLERRNAETRARAESDGEDLDGKSYVIIRKAGETGQLYGSVSIRDIAEMIEDGDVRRTMIKLEAPIKTLGLHDVTIKLHPEVAITVTINVARSEDEAERQAAGEDVIATQQEVDRAEDLAMRGERAVEAAKLFEEGAAPEATELSDDGTQADVEMPADPRETDGIEDGEDLRQIEAAVAPNASS